jgi:hypothetical protein
MREPPMFVFLLTAENLFKAAVIAADADEARLLAMNRERRGCWHTAASEVIADCQPERPCRVLVMERPLERP